MDSRIKLLGKFTKPLTCISLLEIQRKNSTMNWLTVWVFFDYEEEIPIGSAVTDI